MNDQSLGDKIKWLIVRCKGEVSILINNHKGYYESVTDYLKDEIERSVVDGSTISEMIERDTVVTVIAYPDNQVGFYRCYHYDLETAIDYIVNCIKEQNGTNSLS